MDFSKRTDKKEIDWSKWLCRCSSISKIMANSKENAPLTDKQRERMAELFEKQDTFKGLTHNQNIELVALMEKDKNSTNIVLSDTCIQYLLEAYAWETEKMCSITKEMDVEYFERGRKTEPESIDLLTKVDNKIHYKNETRFENDFLSGIPDVLDVRVRDAEIIAVTGIKDIKSCKDYPTFLYKIHKGLDPGNKEQLQGYGDILQCGDLGVVFTLPTMPESIRNGYKMKLAYKMDAAIDQDPEFEKAWAALERSMVFDHMPASKKVYKIPVEPFTKSEKEAVYERVKHCREWLFNFDTMFNKLNQCATV